jgi:RNA polymerase sigma factor (TIGR02999 family)
MSPRPAYDITQLLAQANEGDSSARDEVIRLAYDELRVLARSHRRRAGAGDTVNTTALVHEAYAKLAGRNVRYEDRRQFFGYASRVMRDVLVDYARAQNAEKRGGGDRAFTLKDGLHMADQPSVRIEEVLSLDRALQSLASFDPDSAKVVELRYFAGLPLAEVAEIVGVSERTVKRRWTAARAWLFRELSESSDDQPPPV